MAMSIEIDVGARLRVPNDRRRRRSSDQSDEDNASDNQELEEHLVEMLTTQKWKSNIVDHKMQMILNYWQQQVATTAPNRKEMDQADLQAFLEEVLMVGRRCFYRGQLCTFD
jgi:hypothetical protein